MNNAQRTLGGTSAAAALLTLLLHAFHGPARGTADARNTPAGTFDRARIKHVIVIYQENWSFDGLYSRFRDARGRHANGFDFGRPVPQYDRDGARIDSMDLPVDSEGRPFGGSRWRAHMPVIFYNLRDFESGTAGGMDRVNTADVLHRFYHTQRQINRGPDGHGANDRFLYWSALDVRKPDGRANMNALVLSGYPAETLPLGRLAARYTMCDNCFQSAFGGSFLNHQWLIAARQPVYTNARANPAAFARRSNPADSMPKRWDDALSAEFVPGDTNSLYAINTIEPAFAPRRHKGLTLPAQQHATIGTRLDAAGVAWKWYAQGWTDATRDTSADPNEEFVTHHQPFSYFAAFDPGTDEGRRNRANHLADLDRFHEDLRSGMLPAVSFVKLTNLYDEHPQDANLRAGDSAAAALVREIMERKDVWSDCAVIVTFDEFGGRWDHVVPPPPADPFGPGPRVPMMLFSPFCEGHGIDHTQYETVSILAFIEKIWGLPPLSDRDAHADPFTGAFNAAR